MEIGKSFRYKEKDLENEDIKETRSDNSDGRKSANYETGSDKSEDGYQTARGEGRSIDYEIVSDKSSQQDLLSCLDLSEFRRPFFYACLLPALSYTKCEVLDMFDSTSLLG
jgi:hypothetical protein